MNSTKAELRRALQQARLALSPEERAAKSMAITNRLQAVVDWSQVSTLHFFEPIQRLGEVNISSFITGLQVNYPNLKFFTSKQFDNEWKTFSLGDQQHSTPIQFDVIIVPMLGFDHKLQRVGYGGGFYDRFLATQSQAKKIGVCFDVGRLDQIPAEAHDIPLNLIITEAAAYPNSNLYNLLAH